MNMFRAEASRDVKNKSFVLIGDHANNVNTKNHVQNHPQKYSLVSTLSSKVCASLPPIHKTPRQAKYGITYPKKYPTPRTSDSPYQHIPMASSSHAFPPRSYNTNLGKLPDRSTAGAFGATTAAQQREAQRLERLERERLEKERSEREGQDQMNQLTEEQKEEVNEAVSERASERERETDPLPSLGARPFRLKASRGSSTKHTRHSFIHYI